jgi:hypothetical protein
MSESQPASESERLSETATRLRTAIDAVGRSEANERAGANDAPEEPEESDGATAETESADSGSEGDGSRSDLAEAVSLITRAETDLQDLIGIVRGDREGTLTDAREDLTDLIEVIDEAEDLLSTVDLSALPEAVDWSELPAAIDAGDVPRAIAEGEPSEAIHFRRLLQIVDLRTVLDNVDLRALWEQKRDVEEATDDLTDENEDGGEDDGSILDRFGSDSDDGEENGGFLNRFGSDEKGESGDTAADDTSVVSDDGGGAGGIPSELIQARVQSQLHEAIESFRESALEARDRLKEMRDRSKEQFEEKTGGVNQPSSRNPTAYSTLPAAPDERSDMGGVQRPSTIPRTPRHSSTPGHDRIYGDRFENRGQEKETTNE